MFLDSYGTQPSSERQKENRRLIFHPAVLDPGGGGGHLGIFWVGMCRPGLQDWHSVLKKIPPKMDTLF